MHVSKAFVGELADTPVDAWPWNQRYPPSMVCRIQDIFRSGHVPADIRRQCSSTRLSPGFHLFRWVVSRSKLRPRNPRLEDEIPIHNPLKQKTGQRSNQKNTGKRSSLRTRILRTRMLNASKYPTSNGGHGGRCAGCVRRVRHRIGSKQDQIAAVKRHSDPSTQIITRRIRARHR